MVMRDSSAQHRAAVHELRLASESGERARLEAVLDRRVVMLIDGGASCRRTRGRSVDRQTSR